MSKEKPVIVSDEHLNAFIDDQLDVHEKSEVLDALRHDQSLSQRSCELQKIQDLVQLTYRVPNKPHVNSPSGSHRRVFLHMAIAAGLALVIGLGIGWYGRHYLAPQTNLLDFAQSIHNNTATAEKDEWKILLHVSSYDPYRLNVLLDETEQLLLSNLESSRKLQIEILTNSDGLRLLEHRSSSLATRLQSLQQHYGNLILSACNQTIKRARLEKGIDVQLLPETRVVNSAIGQVLKRQKQGWTYIRI